MHVPASTEPANSISLQLWPQPQVSTSELQWLRDELLRLGPTMIKLGQVASARTDGRFIWSPLIEGSGPLVQHILQHGEASVPPEELAALEPPPEAEDAELEEELGDLARATFSLLCTDGRATCSRKALVQSVRASGLCAPARAKWLVEDTLPGGQEFFDDRNPSQFFGRRPGFIT